MLSTEPDRRTCIPAIVASLLQVTALCEVFAVCEKARVIGSTGAAPASVELVGREELRFMLHAWLMFVHWRFMAFR